MERYSVIEYKMYVRKITSVMFAFNKKNKIPCVQQ